NCVAGNPVFSAAIEIGPLGASLTVRDGTVRIALAGARRSATAGDHAIAMYQSVILAEGETLALGAARDGAFSYLAIEGGVQGEPMFGSLAVNARAGLGSPWPRPLQAGDALEAPAASGAGERAIDLPGLGNGPIRVVMGP